MESVSESAPRSAPGRGTCRRRCILCNANARARGGLISGQCWKPTKVKRCLPCLLLTCESDCLSRAATPVSLYSYLSDNITIGFLYFYCGCCRVSDITISKSGAGCIRSELWPGDGQDVLNRQLADTRSSTVWQGQRYSITRLQRSATYAYVISYM